MDFLAAIYRAPCAKRDTRRRGRGSVGVEKLYEKLVDAKSLEAKKKYNNENNDKDNNNYNNKWDFKERHLEILVGKRGRYFAEKLQRALSALRRAIETYYTSSQIIQIFEEIFNDFLVVNNLKYVFETPQILPNLKQDFLYS